VLGSATLLSLIFLTFAFIQKTEADKLRYETEMARMEAQEAKSISENQVHQASEARVESEKQRQLAIELESMLLACQAKKK
jgi:hypothetical protein